MMIVCDQIFDSYSKYLPQYLQESIPFSLPLLQPLQARPVLSIAKTHIMIPRWNIKAIYILVVVFSSSVTMMIPVPISIPRLVIV